jgi:hypothetical protein
MNTLSIFSGIFVINNSRGYAQKLGNDNESYTALVGSLASIFNSLRFFWSMGTDYYDYKLVYAILLVL